MESIEVFGKTVEEAVKSGLEQLGISEENAEIEVLEQPTTKGILFKKVTLAKVKITKKASDAERAVKFLEGIFDLIKVTDNGVGMDKDDAIVAFNRHATSKIRKAEDLIKVSTMGFRGEALASVAAISKIEMVTRTKDQEMGTKVILEGGQILSKEECGAPYGTTIIIRELFYNTPVRYKFLKKDFTEGGYIENAVERIALINPNISFKLLNNKKEVLQTSGNGNMIDVVYNVFGKDIAQNLVSVDFNYENITIKGVVGKPEIARSNRSNQMFYVNGRFIKDKTLTAAADEAYKTMIPHGKFGFCILDIHMPPEMVDVNVHPAKLEVRFSEEGKVFKSIHYAIKNTLLGVDLTREDNEETKAEQTTYEAAVPVQNTTPTAVNIASEKEVKKTLFELFKGKQQEKKAEELRENTLKENEYVIEVTEKKKTPGSFLRNLNTATEDTVTSKPLAEEFDMDATLAVPVVNKEVDENGDVVEETIINPENGNEQYVENMDEDLAVKNIVNDEPRNLIEDYMAKNPSPIPEYKLLGVAFDTYILLQYEDDVYILDQHAAHERVLY